MTKRYMKILNNNIKQKNHWQYRLKHSMFGCRMFPAIHETNVIHSYTKKQMLGLERWLSH